MMTLSLIEIVLFAFTTSFCAMGYEQLFAKMLVQLSDQAILWESLSIGVFMLSQGIGLLLFPKIKKNSSMKFLKDVECYMTLIGSISLSILLLASIVFRMYWADLDGLQTTLISSKSLFLASLECLLFMLGVLSGLELACLLAIAKQHQEQNTEALQIFGLLMASYYLGALLASVLFILVLIKIPILWSNQLLACLNLTLVIWIQWKHLGKIASKVILSLALVILTGFSLSQPLAQAQLKNFYYNLLSISWEGQNVQKNGPIGVSKFIQFYLDTPSIEHRDSPYQRLDIVPYWDPMSAEIKSQHMSSTLEQQQKSKTLYLNGHYQFSNFDEQSYHEHFAHIPIVISAKAVPNEVLLLGGGDGLLARELFKYSQITNLQQVELDPEMIRLARQDWLQKLNQGSLSDPRLQLYVGDAWTWLKQKQQKFAAIYMDFPYPYDADTARLFSLEFLLLVSKHLLEDGFVVFDYPLNPNSSLDDCVIFKTLNAAGFKDWLSFKNRYEENFILAFKSPQLQGNPSEWMNRFESFNISSRKLKRHWFTDPNNWQDRKLCSDSQTLNTLLKPVVLSLRDPLFY